MKPRVFSVSFGEGVQVSTNVDKHVIITDQPVEDGGQDTGPSPFDLFLSSLATCAGFYALRFCQAREISTDGLGVSMECIFHPEKFHVTTINISLTLPQGFPEKYKKALERSVELCTVKKHLIDPPEFTISMA